MKYISPCQQGEASAPSDARNTGLLKPKCRGRMWRMAIGALPIADSATSHPERQAKHETSNEPADMRHIGDPTAKTAVANPVQDLQAKPDAKHDNYRFLNSLRELHTARRALYAARRSFDDRLLAQCNASPA